MRELFLLENILLSDSKAERFKYYLILLTTTMENVSLKIEQEFAREMERIMKKNRYITKTEFIREAIRDKMKELEREQALKNIDKLFGSSKHKTSDEELHKAREKLAKKYEEKFK